MIARSARCALRLARHWPAAEMIALAPKSWVATRAGLDPRLRAAVEPKWQTREVTVPTTIVRPGRDHRGVVVVPPLRPRG